MVERERVRLAALEETLEKLKRAQESLRSGHGPGRLTPEPL